MLSLITAVHCNPAGLRALHASLAPGLGCELRWLIQDSAACEETRRWVATIDCAGIDFDSTPDSGIYEALNSALGRLQTPYYLVVGSDDEVDLDALRAIASELDIIERAGSAPPPRPSAADQSIGAELTGPPDVVTFPVRLNRGIRRRQPWWPAQINILGLTASHSVGTVIRRDLHARIGLYDTRYRILADSLFLRRAQLAGSRFEHRAAPIPGRFATTGVSHRDHGRLILENLAYNVECGSPPLLQGLMFVVRMLAYRPRSFL